MSTNSHAALHSNAKTVIFPDRPQLDEKGTSDAAGANHLTVEEDEHTRSKTNRGARIRLLE